MTSSIGLRFYKVTAHAKHQRGSEPCDPAELASSVHAFLEEFVASHSEAVDDAEVERSWFFERKASEHDGSIRGYINYGTFGFESTFRSAKTKAKRYDRQVDDVEEVPLFFEFWEREEDRRHIFSFQSFHGRSCVSLVVVAIQKAFEAVNPNYILRFKKLVAVDSPNSLYRDAPVKKLTFIRSQKHSDRFEAYSASGEVRSVNFELSVKPQRGAILGILSDIAGDFEPDDNGVVVIDGHEYEEAVATIMIGGKYRPVGILGPTADTGAVDVTEVVVKGANGHPTFDSIAEQSDILMIDLNNRIGDER
ncbi:hypothetical protein [Brevundimonas sp.]|uniref:hypothetical protein n=1 Tax=Brevundimonas sp. TaxID=1871086 RepID=UPI003F71C642